MKRQIGIKKGKKLKKCYVAEKALLGKARSHSPRSSITVRNVEWPKSLISKAKKLRESNALSIFC